MINFRQKEFSEYDAMRSLYVELMKRSGRDKFKVIDTSSLIPILKGNNIVIERFVISTSMFGADKYRMYIRIGAKAKLPDEVRVPGTVYDKKLLNLLLKMKGGINKPYQPQQNNFSSISEGEIRQKLFGKNKKNNNNNGGGDPIFTEVSPNIDLSVQRTRLLGDAIKYDKKSRLLVLEFTNIYDAINALNILPFGLNYSIYLLDS